MSERSEDHNDYSLTTQLQFFSKPLSLVVVLIGFVGVLGYVYGSVYFYTAGSLTGMAGYAAIAFLLLSRGILCARPDQGIMLLISREGAGSLMARRLLPLAITLPPLVGGLFEIGYHWHLYTEQVKTALVSTSDIILFSGLVGWNAYMLNRFDSDRTRAELSLQQANTVLQKELHTRQQAEEALQFSQARFAGILDIASDAIISVDANQRITLFNQGAEKLFGYGANEVLNQPLDLLLPHRCAVAHRQHISNFGESDGNARCMGERNEIFGRRKDGTEFPAEASISKLEIGGEIVFTAFVRDISDRKRTEEILRESEERFRSAFDNAAIGMALVAIDGHWLKVNRSLCEIVGYTEQELLSLRFQDITHPDDLETDLKYARQLLAGEIRSYQMEKRYFHSRGHVVWILLSGSLVRDTQGNPLYFIAQIQDISARKQAEVALRERQRQLEAIASNMPKGSMHRAIFHVDGRMSLPYISPSIQEITGLTPEEVMAHPEYLLEMTHPDERAAFEQHLKTAIETLQPAHFDFRIITTSGQVKWVQNNSSFHRLENGDVVSEGIVLDITERKQAELEVIQSRDLREAIFNESTDAIFLVDAETRITLDCNRWAVELFEASSKNELIGINGNTLQKRQFTPEDLATIVEEINTRGFWSREIEYVTKGGMTFWGNLAAKQITVAGKVMNLVRITDVSDRKQAEIELQRAKEAAEVANRTKSIFLANMSHELRTPLNVILGFTQVMSRDSSLTQQQRENLQIISKSGNHLLALINDVLDLCKIEAGRITLDESSFDLMVAVRSLRDMLRQKAETKGLQLNLEIFPDVPQYVKTDPNKLRQVLINLLGNAIKFTQRGSVSLNVKRNMEQGKREQKEGSSRLPVDACLLTFEISDTGIGIAPTEVDTIFDAFVQTQAGKVSPDGTGLGLTISRKFVRLMGGDITVSSTLGQGSTFTFEIPVRLALASDVQPTQTHRQVIGLAPDQPPYRILVADDQPENRQLLVKLLTLLGLEVREAKNGEEAVTLWHQWQPHLIWMDIGMPVMDGYEATQRIRSSAEGHTPIIIALTAYASKSDRTVALSVGCNDFVSKPFQQETLFAKMAEYLGLRYVYADTDTQESASRQLDKQTEHTVTSESLCVMPITWISQLHQAALLCDDEEILYLIAQIPSEHTSLIAHLTHLARDFQFQPIVELAQTHSNSTI